MMSCSFHYLLAAVLSISTPVCINFLINYLSVFDLLPYMPTCQESKLEVIMWKRMVANKILKTRLGSSNFVADFPRDTDVFFDIITSTNQDASSSSETLSNHHSKPCKIFVSTWNVGGIAPDEELNMEELLDICNNPCEIYVFGFQEIVPLNASSVLGPDNGKVSLKWNSLIRRALNKKSKHMNDNDDHKSDSPYSTKINETPQEFQCILSTQMVGIFISVWVPNDLRPLIRHPSVSRVGCGIMGYLGNKGSVSVRFILHETSFCFVCSHLASGGREGDEKHRNSDVAEIFSRTNFPKSPSLDLPRKILDHDQVIFLGDLNYRISLPEEATRSLVENVDWNTLLESDQLRMELMCGNSLRGWQEGAVRFAPTYKYWPNSDVYYGCFQGKTVLKKRAPAWCDRIIWYGKGLKQHLYTRAEAKLSDHRPVKAIFTAEVTEFDSQAQED